MSNLPTVLELAPNFYRISINDLTLWVSYSTMIAFEIEGQSRVVSENIVSNSTGKHLNLLGMKNKRVSRGDFEKLWEISYKSWLSHNYHTN